MAPREPLRDLIVGEKILYEGRAYDFLELTLKQPDGSTRPRPIVRHRGAAMVLPLIEQPGRGPKIVFVENDRHTIDDRLLELPAGGIEAGESPEEAAARELREETGYEASILYPLARFYTTPGITDELMHAYVATGLTHVGVSPEAHENITVHTHSTSDVAAKLGSGELLDGKSVLALLAGARAGFFEL
ncbi:MAG: NUDIX hydrolase [Planctomycetota bacterium]